MITLEDLICLKRWSMKDKSDCIMWADCKLIPSSLLHCECGICTLFKAKPFGDFPKVIVRESFLSLGSRWVGRRREPGTDCLRMRLILVVRDVINGWPQCSLRNNCFSRRLTGFGRRYKWSDRHDLWIYDSLLGAWDNPLQRISFKPEPRLLEGVRQLCQHLEPVFEPKQSLVVLATLDWEL